LIFILGYCLNTEFQYTTGLNINDEGFLNLNEAVQVQSEQVIVVAEERD
jgi:hypothetical protein